MSIDPTTLQAPDPEQWDAYDRPALPPPPSQRYLFKAPDKFTYEDHEGMLRVVVDPLEIIDAPEGTDGRIRFERCSSKPRTMGRLAGSSRLTDYLRACGVEPVRSQNVQDWVTAIEQTAGAHFEAMLDWDCYDSETKEQLVNTYQDFPDDPENPGVKLPYGIEPTSGRKVPARARIRYYVTPRK
jgi:hypothetical protein